MAALSMEIMELEKEVEELKVEREIQRMSISESGNELLGYVQEHEKEDFFISKTDRVNFFRDRNGPCTLL